MRKIAVSIVLILVFVLCFAGCSGKEEEIISKEQKTYEDPVTLEQVNTDGRYVARAFLESIFSDNKDLFEKCYPAGFIDRVNQAAGGDIYEQYRSVANISGEISGTAYVDSRDVKAENGMDEAPLRSRICMTSGFEYSEVGLIQIQKIRGFFANDLESIESDFYIVVYEADGNWYMLETYKGAEF